MTGAELKRTRLRLGLTQIQLGAKIDATQPDISRWENGCTIPHAAMLRLAMERIEETMRKDRR